MQRFPAFFLAFSPVWPYNRNNIDMENYRKRKEDAADMKLVIIEPLGVDKEQLLSMLSGKEPT